MYLLLVNLIIAAAAGLTGGFVISLIFTRKLPPAASLLTDAALGCCVFIAVLAFAVAVPVPVNTRFEIVGGSLVISRMNQFQYPFEIGMLLALAIPAAREMWRSHRR